MYHIIINPASRSGEGNRLWAQAEPLFKESGQPYEVYFSEEEEGVRGVVRELTEAEVARRSEETLQSTREVLERPDRFWAVLEDPLPEQNKTDLIIMGGDGSLNEALNGVADFSNVRIGFIPVGSANDFAKDAGISKDVGQTVRTILDGDHRRRLDLGRVSWESFREDEDEDSVLMPDVQNRYFLISSGVGFDAQVCYDADRSRWKKLLNKIRLGKLIYIVTAIRLIRTARRATLDIEVKGGDEPVLNMELEDCLFGVCMNHRFEGGGFQFAPEADPTDGKLDLCVASGISRPRFFMLFPKAYSGGHAGARGVHILQGRSVRFHSDIPMYVHTDGEVPDRTREAVMTVLPGALEFLN